MGVGLVNGAINHKNSENKDMETIKSMSGFTLPTL